MSDMITREDIEKLAAMSRIEVSEEEVKTLHADIDSILEYISTIQEVVTEEPTPTAGTLRNVLRDDVDPHASGIYTERLLEAAPKREGNYFKVKKILQQD